MAFDAKTDWKSGDAVSASEMNRIEQGVAGAVADAAAAKADASAALSEAEGLEARIVALETAAQG